MNGELPTIDPEIREHLARRSSGRLPDGLLEEVAAAVDAVATERSRRLPSAGHAIWRLPGLAAAACLALAVAAGALVAGPRLLTSPAGNNQYAALSASELASLLSAKTQPATNTTLVATVTVDSRNDVCPMNRYPTLGVIEGMGSQVCVMGVDTNAYLSADRVDAPKVSGTFAFRYLGPGVLGLIGQLTLPQAGVTYRATDEWPLQGRMFLVDGWLGAEELLESCVITQQAQTAGDVLLPNGSDCPYDNWLGTDATAPGIVADYASASGAAAPSYDPLGLRGNARHVEAGGMRIIDSIDHAAPVHGVFVVRPVTEGCPGASPIDSRGCGYWRVLARVSDSSLHAPAATPTPPPAPISAYPAERALTTDELAHLLAGHQLATNTALVASVTIDTQPDACPMNSRPTYGVIHGVEPQLCAVGQIGDNLGSVASGQNVFAFRYLGPGVVELLGLIQPASASRLAHAVADDWTQAGKVFMVEGWVGHGVVEPAADHSCDPAAADNCAAPGWLSDVQSPSASQVKYVVDDEMKAVDSILSQPVRFGVYVVARNSTSCPSPAPSQATFCEWRVLARVTNVLEPEPSPTMAAPTSTPTSTPIASAPAKPQPVATPLVPPGGSAIGLFGDGNRPLTSGEFASLWAADRAHLADRIVVAKGPVPTRFQCADAIWEGKPTDVPCLNPSRQGDFIAMEGYWVIQVGSDGKLSILGEIATPDTGFVYTFDQARSGGLYSGKPILVDAWLDWQASLYCDTPPYPSDNPCWGGAVDSYLTATQGNAYTSPMQVQLGAYNEFGSSDIRTGPIHGVFLIAPDASNAGAIEVLARMEIVSP